MTDKLTHHHLTAETVNDEHGKAIMMVTHLPDQAFYIQAGQRS